VYEGLECDGVCVELVVEVGHGAGEGVGFAGHEGVGFFPDVELEGEFTFEEGAVPHDGVVHV
jgi:hypothetical protein